MKTFITWLKENATSTSDVAIFANKIPFYFGNNTDAPSILNRGLLSKRKNRKKKNEFRGN